MLTYPYGLTLSCYTAFVKIFDFRTKLPDEVIEATYKAYNQNG